MKVQVHITLKTGVLDPQGKAIQAALGGLGFEGVGDVRQGKFIELDIATSQASVAYEQAREMCEKLLANTVVENYKVTVLEGN